MRAGSSITRAQAQMDVFSGAVTMQSIIGIMVLALIWKMTLLPLHDWLSISSKHFLSSKGFVSRTPGAERLTHARVSAHSGEQRIMERLRMPWDTRDSVSVRHVLARVSFSICSMVKIANAPRWKWCVPSHFPFHLNPCVPSVFVFRAGLWIRQIAIKAVRTS